MTSHIPFLKKLLENVLHENEGVDPERRVTQSQRDPGIGRFNSEEAQKEAPAIRARRRSQAMRRTSVDSGRRMKGCHRMPHPVTGCHKNVTAGLPDIYRMSEIFEKSFSGVLENL